MAPIPLATLLARGLGDVTGAMDGINEANDQAKELKQKYDDLVNWPSNHKELLYGVYAVLGTIALLIAMWVVYSCWTFWSDICGCCVGAFRCCECCFGICFKRDNDNEKRNSWNSRDDDRGRRRRSYDNRRSSVDSEEIRLKQQRKEERRRLRQEKRAQMEAEQSSTDVDIARPEPTHMAETKEA